MRIELKNDDGVVTALTDERMDNDNFVEMQVGDEFFELQLDELMAAVHAFEQKRILRITRENKYL